MYKNPRTLVIGESKEGSGDGMCCVSSIRYLSTQNITKTCSVLVVFKWR